MSSPIRTTGPETDCGVGGGGGGGGGEQGIGQKVDDVCIVPCVISGTEVTGKVVQYCCRLVGFNAELSGTEVTRKVVQLCCQLGDDSCKHNFSLSLSLSLSLSAYSYL